MVHVYPRINDSDLDPGPGDKGVDPRRTDTHDSPGWNLRLGGRLLDGPHQAIPLHTQYARLTSQLAEGSPGDRGTHGIEMAVLAGNLPSHSLHSLFVGGAGSHLAGDDNRNRRFLASRITTGLSIPMKAGEKRSQKEHDSQRQYSRQTPHEGSLPAREAKLRDM